MPELKDLSLKLWYLDDGTLVGPRRIVRCVLDTILEKGPQLGLHVNLAKCEVFRPSGDQDFPEFPRAIKRISEDDAGLELLGSPVVGTKDFFDVAVRQRVEKVLRLQDQLTDLDNPQVALHLLRGCVSICKINHLLRTVPPEFASEQWTRFDNGLRLSLGRITHTSVPDRAWTQATLPCRMGGLGLRESRTTQKAAFLGSCNFSKPLCHRLLGGELRERGTPLVWEETARTALLEDDLELNNVDLGKVGQRDLQAIIDAARLQNLHSNSPLRDKARLMACAAPHAAAWLRAIPAPSLGLTMSRHEFVLAARLWLGIPVFSSCIRCPCRQLIDPMGDHLLGCGHGPLRIRRHDALRQMLYHALLNDHPGGRIEQRCASDRQLRPGDVFHSSFQNGKPGYFDITVRNTLQPAFLMRGAEQAGVAAEAGVAVKDHLHAAAVEESGGEFYPIVVESFGVWAPCSLVTLREIASRATTHTGLPRHRALTNLMQQLSVLLWRYNARLLRSQLDLSDDVRGWDLAG